MAQPTEAQRRLARRLRALRQSGRGTPITQKQVAEALGASVPLVSSWESAKAVPPEERLRAYALLFSGAASAQDGWVLPADGTPLAAEAEARRRELFTELTTLRYTAQRDDDGPEERRGALGGRFWCFPEDARVRIITTPMWPQVTATIPYANPWHPNHIESMLDADRDASLDLYGHIRAENPTADVRILTADKVTRNDLTGEVVILGQADVLLRGELNSVMHFFARRLEIPVGTRLAEGGDREFDSEFFVTCDEDGEPAYYPAGRNPAQVEAYRPIFQREVWQEGRPRSTRDGYPLLEYDVALIARKENELNLAATVTFCSGIFSRGTFGAVRALTDRNLRTQNEEFLVREFGLKDFWLLTRVPVFPADSGAETVTPDLARPYNRLRSSAPSLDPE